MKYKEKVDKFREIIFQQNKNGNFKWKNKEEFELYFFKFGGKLKEDRKRKKGYLVCLVQTGVQITKRNKGSDLILEVPMEFATKVLVLGGFP